MKVSSRNAVMIWFLIMGVITGGGVMNAQAAREQATFAGGCFWCMEQPFAAVPGVIAVVSGYSGGHTKNPTYEQVCSGTTGHAEAVQITFDPQIISYQDLLDIFWRQIDPTDAGGQFVDRGGQYRSAIFYHTEEQKRLAEQSKAALAKSRRFAKPLVTEILSYEQFFPAEDYHQGYYGKNPVRYKSYRSNSGRDQLRQEVWGEEDKGPSASSPSAFKKPAAAELKKQLTEMQFCVTQEHGTERPFANAYWDNTQPGIYVDIVSGEPLFSSTDKFKSGTGWPSFTRPLEPLNITEHTDRRLGTERTEVRSRQADSHLGHVFNDGPMPTGERYCINSAALRFIPADKLAEEGYSAYQYLFK